MLLRRLLRALLFALALLPAGALSARADDGRPPVPVEVGHPPTPVPVPISQLRPSDIRTAPAPTFAAEIDLAPTGPLRQKELVLFVGGYGSRADDGAFDALKARFPSDRYDVRRLGEDPRYPYDTYGSIDTSATILTQEIRDLGPQYAAVSIVSHSMGGTVVDRAFASGLSAKDGVRTHVAIAGAHNGDDYARVPSAVLPLIAPVKNIVRAVAVVAARDPESAAARDLATAKPIPPPVGVTRLDVGLATDGLVGPTDAFDPGVEQRIFLPATLREVADGHGGSLVNREIADLIVETIRTHRVPADRRDNLTRVIGPLVWDRESTLWRGLLALITIGALSLFLARFLPHCRGLIDQLDVLCGKLLRSVGR